MSYELKTTIHSDLLSMLFRDSCLWLNTFAMLVSNGVDIKTACRTSAIVESIINGENSNYTNQPTVDISYEEPVAICCKFNDGSVVSIINQDEDGCLTVAVACANEEEISRQQAYLCLEETVVANYEDYFDEIRL